jgi:hypothetical protein
MRRNAKGIWSILFSATFFAFSGSAHAQQEFDRDKAAKVIAASDMFKDCHIGINNRDSCNCTVYTGRWNSIAAYWGGPTVHPQPESLQGNPVGYWLYKEKGYLQLSSSPEILTLSEKGRTASKNWKHVTAPGREADTPQNTFERWDVPLATKKFVAITEVMRGERMGVQFADVRYRWVYSLTPLGNELFKNERIPSSGRNIRGWIAPGELTGIDLDKTHESKATFILHDDGWRLQEDCRGDICQ